LKNPRDFEKLAGVRKRDFRSAAHRLGNGVDLAIRLKTGVLNRPIDSCLERAGGMPLSLSVTLLCTLRASLEEVSCQTKT
jgi:hypothetical protein